MSFTPFNAPVLSGLLGDRDLVQHFSVSADIDAMLRFEVALAEAESACGLFDEDTCKSISTACRTFEPDVKAISIATAQDGVCVPELVRQLRAHVGAPYADWVHFGATSQDAIDTSLMFRLNGVIQILETRLLDIEDTLLQIESEHGLRRLMGRTRMQAAAEITVADRIRNWRVPIIRHRRRLDEIKPQLLRLQFGGAVGTRCKLGDQADAVSAELSRLLDLANSPPWHTDRTEIADFAHCLSLITGSLGKIGQDIALMAQNEFAAITLSGTGGSSAVPHKQNPVKAEILVTLARFNATLISGLHHTVVHEQERSGAAWTLEWMILPQMCVSTGSATRTALELLGNIERIGDYPATI